jgi:hypothetical protein
MALAMPVKEEAVKVDSGWSTRRAHCERVFPLPFADWPRKTQVVSNKKAIAQAPKDKSEFLIF